MSWIIFALVLLPLVGAYDAFAHHLTSTAGLRSVLMWSVPVSGALAFVQFCGHSTLAEALSLAVAACYMAAPALRTKHHHQAFRRAYRQSTPAA